MAYFAANGGGPPVCRFAEKKHRQSVRAVRNISNASVATDSTVSVMLPDVGNCRLIFHQQDMRHAGFQRFRAKCQPELSGNWQAVCPRG
jgi:hypothetical protein